MQVFADRMFWFAKKIVEYIVVPRFSYSAKIILVYLVNQRLSLCFTAHYLFYKSANTNVSLGIDDSYWLKLDWRFPTLSQS